MLIRHLCYQPGPRSFPPFLVHHRASAHPNTPLHYPIRGLSIRTLSHSLRMRQETLVINLKAKELEMSERNKTIVRRALDEVYNRGNLDAVQELVTEDFVVHSASQDIHGPDGMRQFVASLREAFPDLRVMIDDQVAEGDRVVTRWTATGTHTGAFHGIPPTGRRGTMTGIDIDRLVDGKAVECWTNADYLGLLQQLGAIPAPDEQEAPIPTP